jgi:ABC-type polysaccharide/polyol phosphate transport system ATPase subunit
VVVVGHNLGFLQEFCTRVIWMHKGRIHSAGATQEIIQAYTSGANELKRAA